MAATKTELTHAALCEELSYNAENGLFFWKKDKCNIKAGQQAGSRHWRGYFSVYVLGKSYLAHRLAWFYFYGKWPENSIDHINGLFADNKISNLRDISQKENMQNRRTPKKNRLEGLLGTHWNPRINKWHATIYYEGKNRHLGVFETAEEAHAVYLQEKRKHHAGCTL
jgi:hypothetical protein